MKKPEAGPHSEDKEDCQTTDFKAQLKKTAVVVKETTTESAKPEGTVTDFKSRLRKVSGTINPAAAPDVKDEAKATAEAAASEAAEAEEVKRKSTGEADFQF